MASVADLLNPTPVVSVTDLLNPVPAEATQGDDKASRDEGENQHIAVLPTERHICPDGRPRVYCHDLSVLVRTYKKLATENNTEAASANDQIFPLPKSTGEWITGEEEHRFPLPEYFPPTVKEFWALTEWDQLHKLYYLCEVYNITEREIDMETIGGNKDTLPKIRYHPSHQKSLPFSELLRRKLKPTAERTAEDALVLFRHAGVVGPLKVLAVLAHRLELSFQTLLYHATPPTPGNGRRTQPQFVDIYFTPYVPTNMPRPPEESEREPQTNSEGGQREDENQYCRPDPQTARLPGIDDLRKGYERTGGMVSDFDFHIQGISRRVTQLDIGTPTQEYVSPTQQYVNVPSRPDYIGVPTTQHNDNVRSTPDNVGAPPTAGAELLHPPPTTGPATETETETHLPAPSTGKTAGTGYLCIYLPGFLERYGGRRDFTQDKRPRLEPPFNFEKLLEERNVPARRRPERTHEIFCRLLKECLPPGAPITKTRVEFPPEEEMQEASSFTGPAEDMWPLSPSPSPPPPLPPRRRNGSAKQVRFNLSESETVSFEPRRSRLGRMTRKPPSRPNRRFPRPGPLSVLAGDDTVRRPVHRGAGGTLPLPSFNPPMAGQLPPMVTDSHPPLGTFSFPPMENPNLPPPLTNYNPLPTANHDPPQRSSQNRPPRATRTPSLPRANTRRRTTHDSPPLPSRHHLDVPDRDPFAMEAPNPPTTASSDFPDLGTLNPRFMADPSPPPMLSYPPLGMAGDNPPPMSSYPPLGMAGHNPPPPMSSYPPLGMAGHNPPPMSSYPPLGMAEHNPPPMANLSPLLVADPSPPPMSNHPPLGMTGLNSPPRTTLNRPPMTGSSSPPMSSYPPLPLPGSNHVPLPSQLPARGMGYDPWRPPPGYQLYHHHG
ncbi:uncharacterized protein Z518_06013 [Rhinocladiella mackenziei CBS 650.93]|uniref:Uncharacterized protein n=1 Tax=Rhinocladiella mackenziei CBS 650.93 TaxID=1442369 RepID=A0A0D2IPQ2_9EURO|nr:uncharacterized protein Z518_06013 [Rhinocladiella mackenziei CBS 650.93]KIX05141.1 hypothetical protein Z518_06013 [Rhinocladiella mackenziei CBS 650.93]